MFKDRLKELRIKKGLTQKELGNAVYVSRSAICKWEMGNGIPSDVNLQALCEFFDVEEEWFLDRIDLKENVSIYKGLWKIVVLNIFGMIIPVFLILYSNIDLIIYNKYKDGFYYVQVVQTFRILDELKIWIIIPFTLYIVTLVFSIFDFIVNLGIINRKFKRKYSYIILISLLVLCIIIYVVSYSFAL